MRLASHLIVQLSLALSSVAVADADAEQPVAAQPIIVATTKGILRLDAGGKVIGTLSKTRARYPRFVPGTHDLIFLARDVTELRLISLDEGAGPERVVAKLPGSFKSCEKTSDYERGHRFKLAELAIQSGDDVDVGNGEVCLTLQDRNDNMMSFQAVVRITLATGAVHAQSVGCPGATDGSNPCKAVPARTIQSAGTRSAELPFGIDNGYLSALGAPREAAKKVDGGLYEEDQSPSGRWVVVVALTQDQGDYVYRRLFLLDRKDGAIYPVRKKGWPKPLTEAQLRNVERVGDKTLIVTGEDPVRWLDDGRLRAGELLIAPGRGGSTIDGDLAE